MLIYSYKSWWLMLVFNLVNNIFSQPFGSNFRSSPWRWVCAILVTSTNRNLFMKFLLLFRVSAKQVGASTVSVLSIASSLVADSGNYTCTLPDTDISTTLEIVIQQELCHIKSHRVETELECMEKLTQNHARIEDQCNSPTIYYPGIQQ